MRFFSKLYEYFQLHFRALSIATLVFLALCGVFAANLVVREDVTFLMPSKPENLAKQFALLRVAPILQGLTITVSGDDPGKAADMLAASLRGPTVPTVFSQTGAVLTPQLLTRFCAASPALMDESFRAALPEHLTEDALRTALDRNMRILQDPRGIALRDIIAMDPLGICGLSLQHIASGLNKNAFRMENGHLLSADGRYALVLAEPATSIGDSSDSSAVMQAVQNAISSLPVSSGAIVVGGHRHAEANATVIRQDGTRIIPISLVLLALAYGIYVRTLQGVAIVLLPMAALIVAIAGTGFVHGTISGIVIGFGSVVLGITADYAIHVYYAVRNGKSVPQSLDAVSRPLLLAAATTLAIFATFFLSSVPAVSQMALFAVFGVLTAVVFSLVILPHFLSPAPAIESTSPNPFPQLYVRPIFLGLLWSVLIIALVLLFRSISINGDARALSYVSEDIIADENRTREIWGGLRERAIFAVSGRDLEEALQKNDALWKNFAALEDGFDRSQIMSLAPIFPSQATQDNRRAAWRDFWLKNGQETVKFLDMLAPEVGFSQTAFVPFQEWMSNEPEYIRPEMMLEMGLALPLLLARNTDKNSIVYSLMPSEAPTPEFLRILAENGASYVSGHTFREALSSATRDDLIRFGSLSLAAIIFMTAIMLRSLSRVGVVLLPIAAGLTAVLSVFKLFGISFNIFHAMALPLVMTLSVDYGIFMLARLEGVLGMECDKAVQLSGITSLSSFGALLLADHPALFSIGLTVTLGLTAALGTALFLLPRLAKKPPSPAVHPSRQLGASGEYGHV
jgi:predicted exporter